ncbi:OB-fold-like protein [Raphanus sativus]|nr:OB-fold-like protein [Raphanus sativus]
METEGNEVVTHLWWCEKCDDKVTQVLPKFRIHVMVKYGSGEAYLMLLDWIASRVAPESASHLLNGSLEELKDVESFPEAITSLIGKTFMFGVYIESAYVSSKGGMYKVGKMWKDLSMLLTAASTSQSLTWSDGLILLMESQAVDGTVVTPSSKRKESNEGESDISSTTKKLCPIVFVKKEKTSKEKSNTKKVANYVFYTKLKESSLSVLRDFELLVVIITFKLGIFYQPSPSQTSSSNLMQWSGTLLNTKNQKKKMTFNHLLSTISLRRVKIIVIIVTTVIRAMMLVVKMVIHMNKHMITLKDYHRFQVLYQMKKERGF